jgi:Tol biopolymer transport system component/DNA-binding winged helix-turn-helix (wHTH) protein
VKDQSSELRHFDDIAVDPARMHVRKANQILSLEPKSLKLLLYLLENRDRLVTKEELVQAVWQDTFITDNAVTRAVAQLRKALGDDAKQAKYIETVPRLGYRFIAEMKDAELVTPSELPPEVQPARPPRWALLAVGMAAVVGAALLATAIRPQPVASRTGGLKTMQLTTSSALDLYPTFSPDSSSVAYASDRTGAFEIFIKPLASGARDIQVTSDGQQNLQPAWSSDGRYIAYYSVKDTGIFVMPALGGPRRRLTDFGTQPAWSKDSKWIVFQSHGLISLSAVDQTCGPFKNEIWLVPLEGGAPKPLNTGQHPGCGQRDPSWTPDGKSILYVSLFNGGRSEFTLIAPDGTGLRKISSPDARIMNPVWSPDGSGIYYSTFSRPGDFIVRRLPIGRDGSPAGDPVEVLPESATMPRALAISSDGHHIAFTASLSTSQLLALPVSPQTHAPTGPPSPVLHENLYRYTEPQFSPDAKHLLYVQFRKGSQDDIWMSDSDGSNATQLTATPNEVYFPSGWLPDGSGILFAKYPESGTELWKMSFPGHAEERMKQFSQPVAFPSLSPDGREVVYNAGSKDGFYLWKLELATGKTTQLTSDPKVFAGIGRWSPNGKWIAFQTHTGDDSYAGVVSSDGRDYKQLTTEAGQSWPWSWAPDNDTIVYAGSRQGVWNLWQVSRTTRIQKRLTDYTSLRTFVRYPAWSPRGDRIVYEFNETKGNIYVADLTRSRP